MAIPARKSTPGSHCEVMVDGRPIAFGEAIVVNEDYNETAVKRQGSIETIEFQKDDYNVSFQLSKLFLPEEAVGDAGFFPKKGKDADEHLSNAAALPPLTIVVLDKARGGKVIGRAEGAVFSANVWNNARGGMVSEGLSGSAIRFLTGSEL